MEKSRHPITYALKYYSARERRTNADEKPTSIETIRQSRHRIEHHRVNCHVDLRLWIRIEGICQ